MGMHDKNYSNGLPKYLAVGAIRGRFAAAVLALKIALFRMSPNGPALSVFVSLHPSYHPWCVRSKVEIERAHHGHYRCQFRIAAAT